MNKFCCFGRKLQCLLSSSCMKLVCLSKPFCSLVACYRYVVFRVNPFWVNLCYFITLSVMGFFGLKVLKPRMESFRPQNFDLFFMSVSATTVSSMSSIEMEFFSNNQLVIMTLLMFFGGEVFTSMLGLQFAKFKFKKDNCNIDKRVDSTNINTSPIKDEVELGIVPSFNFGESNYHIDYPTDSEAYLKYNSIRYLGYIVLGYLLVMLVGGSALVMLYMSQVTSAHDVLKNKGLQLPTFSVFTIVSTFTNCGFIPTNENMIAFKNNPGLLLLLIPQILLGNTLFPVCLRTLIWVLRRFMKRDELSYLLQNTREIGFLHLLPSLQSVCLVVTVIGLIMVQFVLFCCIEWHSEGLDGMNTYEKIVGALFTTVNARHTGESVVDLSTISPAILVLFVMMMYLPPYTSFLPVKEDGGEDSTRRCNEKKKTKRSQLVENLLFSQLAYLVIFIILICITERKKMKADPLNFTVLNIVFEVISAYGNVGFTTGYSCKRRLNTDSYCKDTWYGFSGRWSNQGKMLLILVMFFGRFKKFNMEGGRAWKLL